MDPSKALDINYVAETVSNILKNEGSVPSAQYKSFWVTLNTPEVVTSFLTILLVKLLAIETGEDKPLVELISRLKSNVESASPNTSNDKDAKSEEERIM